MAGLIEVRLDSVYSPVEKCQVKLANVGILGKEREPGVGKIG